MSYCVYKHTCPNGKVYIGITSQKPSHRWLSDGRGYSHNEHFYRAILRYGWDNIKHEILFDNLSRHDACKIEISLIEKHRSNNPQYGYNLSSGGECSGSGVHRPRSEVAKLKQSFAMTGRKATEETKEKMRLARIGKSHPHGSTKGHYQPPHSEEWKKEMSARFKGENNPNYGKEMSEEQKRKISENTKSKKAVIGISMASGAIKEFQSAKQAERETGAFNSNIIACCKGKQKSAGGYTWKYKDS